MHYSVATIPRSHPNKHTGHVMDFSYSKQSLELKAQVLPVVRYALQRRLRGNSTPSYWDHASLLELSILEGAEDDAFSRLVKVLDTVEEAFQPETTANNLRMIHEARKARGDDQAWLKDIIDRLAVVPG